jgi:WD40 repeat protein
MENKLTSILSYIALFDLACHTNTVTSVAWSPDGQLLASGSADRTVRPWDGHKGVLLHTLEGHTDRVTSVAWSPDGQIFVSQSDTMMRLWRTHSWETLQVVEKETTQKSRDTLYFFPNVPRLSTLYSAAKIWPKTAAVELQPTPTPM